MTDLNIQEVRLKVETSFMTPSGDKGGIPVTSRAGRVSGLISNDTVFLNRPNKGQDQSQSATKPKKEKEGQELEEQKVESLNASLSVPLAELKKTVRHRVKETRDRFTAANSNKRSPPTHRKGKSAANQDLDCLLRSNIESFSSPKSRQNHQRYSSTKQNLQLREDPSFKSQ